MTPSEKVADDLVIGAGIVGLATAWHLARSGRRVAVIERHTRAQGASIRNFGMIWPVGQPSGPRREMALRSRALWREVLLAADIWHEPVGSLHLAYHDDEAQVLEEFAECARLEGLACELLPASEVPARSPRVNTRGLRLGLWSPHEMVVDPREAVARLPGWLERTASVHFEFGVLATDWEAGRLETTRGVWRADRCFACPGDEVQVLFPTAFASREFRHCKLQMMRTRPVSWQLGPMLAAGLTLVHYDAFAGCPSQPALRARFAAELPEYLDRGIHVMVSQNGRRELTIGDSHEYDQNRTPFDSAEIETLVLDYLGQFFDLGGIEIATRWHGTYLKHRSEAFCAFDPAPGATVLAAFGGAGMTLSFAAAEQVVRAQQT